MLSKREREYIEKGAEAFKEQYGYDNTAMVRSRIRKKVKTALQETLEIIEREGPSRYGDNSIIGYWRGVDYGEFFKLINALCADARVKEGIQGVLDGKGVTFHEQYMNSLKRQA
jgi:hypothetical protein